jgi:hypothetical protein
MVVGDGFGVGDNRSASHRMLRTGNVRICDDRSACPMREAMFMLLARSRTRHQALVMLQQTSLTPAMVGPRHRDCGHPGRAISTERLLCRSLHMSCVPSEPAPGWDRQPAWIKTQNRKHKVNWARGAGIRRWYDGWIAHTSARNATRGWSCNAPAVIAGPAKQSLPRGVQIASLRSQRRAWLWRLSPLPLRVLSFSDRNDRLRSRPAPSLDAAARVQE